MILFENVLLDWVGYVHLISPDRPSDGEDSRRHFSDFANDKKSLKRQYHLSKFSTEPHPFSIFQSQIVDDKNIPVFLCPIVNLPNDSRVKGIFYGLVYSGQKDFYNDYVTFKWKNGEFKSYPRTLWNIPTFESFKSNICDFEAFKRNMIYSLESVNIAYYKSGKLPETDKRVYTIGVFPHCHLDFNYSKKEFKGIPENNHIIDKMLRETGFPYGSTFQEYERYLDEQEKSLGFTIYSHNKKMQFPASLLHKILWKAPINRKDFISHTYVVARSGSGKSEFLKTLIREMGGSCILIDPHGDLANSLDGKKGFLKVAPKEKRFVINPFDITDKTRENRELVGQEITDLIGELIADSGLSNLMYTVVKPVIQTLLKLPYSDFAMLADCFNPVSGLERLEALTPLVDDTIMNWDAILGDQHDNTKHSIFNRLVSFLNNGIVRDTVCGLDDFGDVIGRIVQGENLAVSVPSPTIGSDVSEVLGRFFMCRMQIWAKSRHSIPEHLRTPVFLIVDECQNFLSKMTANTLDQFGRKFGLFMVLSHQHIKQIEDTVLKDSILTNCKNKIVGQASKATRQALASEMGLEQSDFEGLGRGYYWGTFEHKGTIKFYSQMVKFKDSGDRVQYATSQNRAYVNGWDIVGDNIAPDTKTHAKTQEKTRKPPKYDV